MNSFVTKSVVATALTATSLTVGGAVAGAAPAAPGQPNTPSSPPVTVQVAPGVQYTGDGKTGATELTTPFGVVRTAPGQVSVVDNGGRALVGNPDLTGPAPAAPAKPAGPSIKTNAAAPGATAAADAPKTQAEKNDAIQEAINTAGGNFGLATGVGAMVGGVGGAVIGCPIGAITGGGLTAIALPVAPLAALGGCVMGAGAVGGLGGIIGGAAVGIPVGIASGMYEYQKLQANGDL
jgi:hypothetical protein